MSIELERRPDESTEAFLERIHGPGAAKELRIAAAQEYAKECEQKFGVEVDKASFAHGLMYGIQYAEERCFDRAEQ